MGRDRYSITKINDFLTLIVDKDHRGFFRGNQAMSEGNSQYYRGVHYHIESNTITQKEIMEYLENYLETKLKATQIYPKIDTLGIGYINSPPEIISIWELKEMEWNKEKKDWVKLPIKTSVLWIGYLGKLHIETNKYDFYKKGIFLKTNLIQALKEWKLNQIDLEKTIQTTNQIAQEIINELKGGKKDGL